MRQSDLLLIAGDIDHRACDISYIQLSLLGYAAVVQHADALAMKRISPDRYTPGYFLHSMPMRRPFAAPRAETEQPAALPVRDSPQPSYHQPDLFGGEWK